MALKLVAKEDDGDRRLDRVLRKALEELPLSAIHRLLRKGCVLVNGAEASPGLRIRAGDSIEIPCLADYFPVSKRDSPAGLNSKAGGAEIIFDGAGLLIVNKPAGIPVHGKNSLASRLEPHLSRRVSPSLSFKPGPLHRLDAPTSGLIAFSTSLEGARFMTGAIREGRIRKFYLALVEGRISNSEVWEDNLIRDSELKKTIPAGEGGKPARTAVFPAAYSGAGFGHTLLYIETGSGRTHQIRSQAAHHGCPLAGDVKYGGHRSGGGIFLHAVTLIFPDDRPPPLPQKLSAALPPEFRDKIHSMFGLKFKLREPF